MIDYKAIFQGVEGTLIRVGSQNVPAAQISRKLDEYKRFEGKALSDADYYWILVCVTFYSGFRAARVDAKLELIRQHFPDHETVAAYDEDRVNGILDDTGMIRNRRKVQACVSNAKTFQRIVDEHGSFQKYVGSFGSMESFENLMLLKEELEYRFDGLGPITTYHFMTDIGMKVLKPDRVICRIFRRLGLIESDEQLLKAVIQGRKFAQATEQPIRYIDIVFVAYGQMEFKDFGILSGICLDASPSCDLCGVSRFCAYHARNTPSTAR